MEDELLKADFFSTERIGGDLDFLIIQSFIHWLIECFFITYIFALLSVDLILLIFLPLQGRGSSDTLT